MGSKWEASVLQYNLYESLLPQMCVSYDDNNNICAFQIIHIYIIKVKKKKENDDEYDEDEKKKRR